MAVTNAREDQAPVTAKPDPTTWLDFSPARAVLRAVTVSIINYGKLLLLVHEHSQQGHDVHPTIIPGRGRVICRCGVDQWV